MIEIAVSGMFLATLLLWATVFRSEVVLRSDVQ